MAIHLTPTELAREAGMHRQEVIVKCMQLGVPIFQGRIDKTLFLASSRTRSAGRPPRRRSSPEASGVEQVLRRAEELEVDSLVGHAEGAQAEVEQPHEALGTAEVEVGLGHGQRALDPVHGDPPGVVVVGALHVAVAGELVEDDRADVGMASAISRTCSFIA